MTKSQRNYWPAVLIAIPFSAVLFGMLMLYLASSQQVSLVKKDYYQHGRSINQNLKPYEKARQLGLQAMLSYSDQKLAVKISSGDSAWQPPAQLRLEFDHATLADKDFVLTLPRDQAKQDYAVQLPSKSLNQLQGKWYLFLIAEQQDWAIRQSVIFPLQQVKLFTGRQ